MIKLDSLDKNKVLRYIGYNKNKHTLSDDMSKLIDKCIETVLNFIDPKITYSPELNVTTLDTHVLIGNMQVTGQDIRNHLKGCDKAILMAATLGSDLDALIRTTEQLDMTSAVIMDAAANVAVEDVADICENEIREKLKQNNRYLTLRYSPGYGDVPISTQRKLINILDAPIKIGLTVTNSNIMIPRKSITGIMGTANVSVTGKRAGCGSCVMRDKCVYRLRGVTCD